MSRLLLALCLLPAAHAGYATECHREVHNILDRCNANDPKAKAQCVIAADQQPLKDANCTARGPRRRRKKKGGSRRRKNEGRTFPGQPRDHAKPIRGSAAAGRGSRRHRGGDAESQRSSRGRYRDASAAANRRRRPRGATASPRRAVRGPRRHRVYHPESPSAGRGGAAAASWKFCPSSDGAEGERPARPGPSKPERPRRRRGPDARRRGPAAAPRLAGRRRLRGPDSVDSSREEAPSCEPYTHRRRRSSATPSAATARSASSGARA